MTSLLFEDQSVAGQPAIHALVVGVSGYPYLPRSSDPAPPGGWAKTARTLGLVQLDSAALGAFRVARWLVDNEQDLALPLGSVRALLSPSSVEIPKENGLENTTDATLKNLRAAAEAWRSAAATHSDSLTIFYFAGHGVQRRIGDHVLLLHDFGKPDEPLLESAFTTDRLFRGMRPSPTRTNQALRQVSFIDACQLEPSAFRDYYDDEVEIETGTLWNPEKPREEGRDDRNRPTFFATTPGRPAYGFKDSHSVFCEALLRCLKGGAAVRPFLIRPQDPERWRVTAHSLKAALELRVKDVNSEAGTSQVVLSRDMTDDFDLRTFPTPPDVDVMVDLRPADARACTSVTLSTAAGKKFRHVEPPIKADEPTTVVPAGQYICLAAVSGDPKPYRDPEPFILDAVPPRQPVALRLS